MDHAYAHKAFQEKLGVTIPLLADFEPKGRVAQAYGVYIDGAGFCKRALVVIDPEGIVKHVHVEPTLDEVPGANVIFDALSS